MSMKIKFFQSQLFDGFKWLSASEISVKNSRGWSIIHLGKENRRGKEMQDNSEQIKTLNERLQVLEREMKSTLESNLTPDLITSKNITGHEAELERQKSFLVKLNANLSRLEEKFSEAKKVYDDANTLAIRYINIWMKEYMPHLLNQQRFVDAFIRENKNFKYTLFEEPDPYGDNLPRKDPACLYVEQYNKSLDARDYGQVNRAADPFFHLNDQEALRSIRSSISKCQSESDVVELFQKFLVYGSENQEHKNAVEAMANYFFSKNQELLTRVIKT